jgi:hypothetical protein
MHSLSIFGVRTNHKQIWTNKAHHGLDLGEATTFPFIVYFVHFHEAHIQMAFCFGTPPNGSPKIPRVGIPATLCADLWLRWSLKQSCSPCREFFNGMSHNTWTQGNQGDSWLLVIQSQIVNLILDLFFGHNLCFKCFNGSCQPILNIYVSIDFQWYKKLFNPIKFDLCNCPLKIWESIAASTPKMGDHLGVWGFIPSHSFILLGTWDVTPRLPLLARNLARPCLGHEPKVRVVTNFNSW